MANSPSLTPIFTPLAAAGVPVAASGGRPPASVRPYLFSICGCVFFAIMGLLAHHLGEPAEPGGLPRVAWPVVAFVRSVVATILAATLTYAVGAKFVVWSPGVMWVRSLAGSTSMMATFYALARLPTSDVLTLTNTSPVWVAILSWPLLRERPGRGVWLAVLVAVAGVAVALQPSGRAGDVAPAALALVAAFFTAVAMLGLNRLGGLHPFAIVTHFSAVSAVFGLVGWLSASELGVEIDAPGDPSWARNPEVWLGVVGVGTTAFLGQVFLTLAFSRGVATRVSVVGLTQVAMVMLGEQLLGWKDITPLGVLGTAMVLGPTAWLMLRRKRLRDEG